MTIRASVKKGSCHEFTADCQLSVCVHAAVWSSASQTLLGLIETRPKITLLLFWRSPRELDGSCCVSKQLMTFIQHIPGIRESSCNPKVRVMSTLEGRHFPSLRPLTQPILTIGLFNKRSQARVGVSVGERMPFEVTRRRSRPVSLGT